MESAGLKRETDRRRSKIGDAAKKGVESTFSQSPKKFSSRNPRPVLPSYNSSWVHQISRKEKDVKPKRPVKSHAPSVLKTASQSAVESFVNDNSDETSDPISDTYPFWTSPEVLSSHDIQKMESSNPRLKSRYLMKILVIGNAKCGKSSLIERYVNDSFSEEYNTTIGADYRRKAFNIGNNTEARLQLWDIAGQDRFASLTRPYYRNAAAAVIVCDLTRGSSIEAVRSWKDALEDKLDDLPVIIMANKCDLLASTYQAFAAGARMQQLCAEKNFQGWFIGSAKEDANVSKAFEFLVRCVITQKLKQSDDLATSSNDGSNSLVKEADGTVKLANGFEPVGGRPASMDAACC